MNVYPKIVVALKRGSGNNWTPKEGPTSVPTHTPTSTLTSTDVPATPALLGSAPAVNSVVDNVSSFLHGIRASFRQDNIIVTTNQLLSKGSVNLNLTNAKST